VPASGVATGAGGGVVLIMNGKSAIGLTLPGGSMTIARMFCDAVTLIGPAYFVLVGVGANPLTL
jgi:hypothetical protein